MSDDERRRAKRYTLWVPIQMEQGPDVQVLAVSRNISGTGVLVIAGAKLEVGAKLSLTLSVPSEDDRALTGTIVRVEPNEEDPEGLWRHRLAIQFDTPVPELEAAFERLEKRE
ncbi:MAG: PilZ domain-containing protein [Sandaracinaceae bacterium]